MIAACHLIVVTEIFMLRVALLRAKLCCAADLLHSWLTRGSGAIALAALQEI